MLLKNALLSTKKNIGKTILLFIIMSVIANLIIAGLAIQNAADKSMEQIRSSLGNDITLSIDMRSMMGNRDKGEAVEKVMPVIDEEMADSIKTLNYVEDYNYILSSGAYSKDISPIELTSSQDDRGGMQRPSMNTSDFTLYGQTTMEKLSEFEEGQYVLTDGKLLSQADSDTNLCVIETQLASDNDLSVGDTFKVYLEEGTEYELEIAGIFEIQSSTESGRMMFKGGNTTSYNNIYTSLDYIQEITNSNELSSAIYYLDDPKNIEAFIELAKTSTDIDFETYTLEADDFAYERSISSLENMETFTTLFLIVVIIAGSAILCLILILTIKGRFYEFGIFLSLGQSKTKIILQQFIEMMIIVCLALCLSVGTGKIVANGISGMLQSAVSNQNSVIMEMPQGGMEKPQSDNTDKQRPAQDFMDNAFKPVENKELDVSLDLDTITQLSIISIGICMVSILLPSLYVLRLSPREILIKREG